MKKLIRKMVESTTTQIKPEACPRMTLNNGTKIPVIGVGTYCLKSKELVKSAILDHGYRHIDTAKDYENEHIIGEALKEAMDAGVPRSELFVTTKLWFSDYNDIEGACRKSLSELKLDYVDLYMIHWMHLPIDYESEDWRITSPPFHVLWEQMEALVSKGLTRGIAVSNCTMPMMANLLAGCKIKPAINQIEIHPYLNRKEVLHYHNKWGVALEAYSSIGATGTSAIRPKQLQKVRLLEDPTLKEIAESKGKTPAQIVLAWHVKRGTIPLVKTSRVEKLSENINVFDFELTKEEVDKIDAIDKGYKFVDPKPWRMKGIFMNLPYFE